MRVDLGALDVAPLVIIPHSHLNPVVSCVALVWTLRAARVVGSAASCQHAVHGQFGVSDSAALRQPHARERDSY